MIAFSGKSGGACPTAHLHFELRDITKLTLKEMVFEPKFNQELTNHKDTFIYIVNNANTEKSLNSLSKLYFGIEKFWKKIKNVNSDLNIYKRSQILPDEFKVVVPNYK